LCAMLGQPDLPKDPRFASHEGRGANMAELLGLADAWFLSRTFDEAIGGLRAHDVPHSPIMSMADIFADPHYRARQTIVDVPSAVGPLPQPAVLPRSLGTPAPRGVPPPPPGPPRPHPPPRPAARPPHRRGAGRPPRDVASRDCQPPR